MPTASVPIMALQEAVYTRLNADLAGLTLPDGATVEVYDDVPSDAVYPYVELCEHQYTGNDTKDKQGQEGGITIEVWSDYAGKKESNLITQAICDSLTASPLDAPGSPLEDWVVIHVRFDEITSGRRVAELDGHPLYHSVIRQRLLFIP